jgi:histidinol-phosphate aminotransferase
MSLFRDNIVSMPPYVPGEQPARGSRVIKLNTNENPYPPSPAALAVLRELDAELLRRYCDPAATELRLAAAKVYGVDADWIIAGNGSDDLLAMVMLACAAPGRKAAYAMPTYVLYRTLAQMQDAPFDEPPYDEDYHLPMAALLAAQAAVTLVATPNSPSGTSAPTRELAELAAGLRGLLVIDEAYVDFAEADAMELVKQFPNVLVLRTLSKGYGLAGLRVGLGVGQPALLEGLVKVKDSYNVGAIPAAVGAAALGDQAYKNACAAKVKASRARLSADLARLGFRVWPSQSNFLLARPADGQAARLYLGLKERGILVRYFNEPRLDDKLRITVGADEQNQALTAALAELT